MALNIKDPETERLAAEVAALAAETKTGAIRVALLERKQRLTAQADRRGRSGRLRRFLIDEAGLAVVPFAAEDWQVAVDAYLRYGKGRHPAALNFGDCLTYAICRQAGQPLLCVGDDFTRTDLDLVD